MFGAILSQGWWHTLRYNILQDICALSLYRCRRNSVQTRQWWSWKGYCQQQTTLSLCMLSMMKIPVTLSLQLPPHVRHPEFPFHFFPLLFSFLCFPIFFFVQFTVHEFTDKSSIWNLLFPSLFILLSLPAVPLPSPVSINFPMVTHSTLKVSWVPGTVDVPGHRITYSTNHGSDVKQVI